MTRQLVIIQLSLNSFAASQQNPSRRTVTKQPPLKQQRLSTEKQTYFEAACMHWLCYKSSGIHIQRTLVYIQCSDKKLRLFFNLLFFNIGQFSVTPKQYVIQRLPACRSVHCNLQKRRTSESLTKRTDIFPRGSQTIFLNLAT